MIHFGNFNNRIYLMKLSDKDMPDIIDDLDDMAVIGNHTKIFAKIPFTLSSAFFKAGYVKEAGIPLFYGGKDEALFIAKYFSDYRNNDPGFDRVCEILEYIEEKIAVADCRRKDTEFEIRRCFPGDADEISRFYGRIFKTYPFPIDDPLYIKDVMRDHVVFYCVLDGGEIIAMSSAEIDYEHKNAEMTDFATHPDYRGRGIAGRLLYRMENDLEKEDILTFYSIARAMSYGMNITFKKAGYTFSGTLVNNTNIAGQIESMNIWYKNVWDKIEELHTGAPGRF